MTSIWDTHANFSLSDIIKSVTVNHYKIYNGLGQFLNISFLVFFLMNFSPISLTDILSSIIYLNWKGISVLSWTYLTTD